MQLSGTPDSKSGHAISVLDELHVFNRHWRMGLLIAVQSIAIGLGTYNSINRWNSGRGSIALLVMVGCF